MKRNSISNATSEKAVVENSTKNNSVESRKKIESLLKRISGNPKILDRDLDMINRSLALGDSDENKRYMDHIVKFLKIRLKKEYHLENDSTLLKEIDNYVSVVRQEHNGKAIVADSTENSSVESPKTIKSLFMRRNSLPNSTFEKALVENSTKNNSVESRKKIESLLKSISGNPKVLDRDLDMINRSLALGDSDGDKRYMDHIVKCLKVRLKEEYHLENDSTLLKEIDNYVSVVRQEHNGKAIVADSTENSSVESPKTIKSLFMRRNSLPNSTFEKALVENSTKNNSVESRKKIESLLKSISGNPKVLDRDLDMINRSLALGDSDGDKRYMDHIVKCLKVRLKEEYHLENDSTLLKEIDNYVSVVRQEHSEKGVKIPNQDKANVDVSAQRKQRSGKLGIMGAFF